MRVLVLGASGVIGTHMRLAVPENVEPLWYRQSADPVTSGWDLSKPGAGKELVQALYSSGGLDAVINLAGVSDVDAVETAWLEECEEAAKHYRMNVLVPRDLAETCGKLGIRYVHVSSQAVFDGKLHPYHPQSPTCAVNEYGSQKIRAEAIVRSVNPQTVIVRPSLVLGVRPMPHCGRRNPIEGMLDGSQPNQVADRWFSPLFARDAAQGIWDAVCAAPGETRHLGIPRPWSRYEIAGEVERLTGTKFTSVRHESFEGLAPRPMDTTYGEGSYFSRLVDSGVAECLRDTTELYRRAREIAIFLGIPEQTAIDRLECGFGPAHAQVTADFRRHWAGRDIGNMNTDSLLDWYRETEAYIWELTAYHMDPKYNYAGLCRNIVDRLAPIVGDGHVLCLGDGIGDLTWAIYQTPMAGIYHDLKGSRTAEYAKFRFWNQTGCEMPVWLTDGWKPELVGPLDAVVALDFLEHVPNVEAWVRAIWESLAPGGMLVSFNSFAQGSGPAGEMPMHLAVNDRYEQDWDPMVRRIGFVQEGSNWYRRV